MPVEHGSLLLARGLQEHPVLHGNKWIYSSGGGHGIQVTSTTNYKSICYYHASGRPPYSTGSYEAFYGPSLVYAGPVRPPVYQGMDQHAQASEYGAPSTDSDQSHSRKQLKRMIRKAELPYYTKNMNRRGSPYLSDSLICCRQQIRSWKGMENPIRETIDSRLQLTSNLADEDKFIGVSKGCSDDSSDTPRCVSEESLPQPLDSDESETYRQGWAFRIRGHHLGIKYVEFTIHPVSTISSTNPSLRR